MITTKQKLTNFHAEWWDQQTTGVHYSLVQRRISDKFLNIDAVTCFEACSYCFTGMRSHCNSCPCASMRVHALQCTSLSTQWVSMSYWLILVQCWCCLWSPFLLRLMCVHALACVSIRWRVRPWGAVHIHVLQFTSMCFTAHPQSPTRLLVEPHQTHVTHTRTCHSSNNWPLDWWPVTGKFFLF